MEPKFTGKQYVNGGLLEYGDQDPKTGHRAEKFTANVPPPLNGDLGKAPSVYVNPNPPVASPNSAVDNSPGSPTAQPANAASTSKSAAAESQPAQYTIKTGDTLSALAEKNGTNIQALMKANPDIKNPDKILAGAKLNLPGAPTGTPAKGTANEYQNKVLGAVHKVTDQNNMAAVGAAAASVAYGEPLPPAAAQTVDSLIGTITKQITDLNAKAPVDLVQNYKALSKELGIDDLNTEYINTEKIINGTEDDIRAEVTKAGGFMSESQVQALAGARNKSLILKANALMEAISSKQDTLKTLSGLSVDEQKMADDRVSTAVGLETKLLDTQQTMQTHATDAYNKIVTNVGYQGLAGALAGDPYSQALAERSLSLPPGTLSNPAALKQLETYRQQTITQGQQRINISVQGQGSLIDSRTARAAAGYASAINTTIHQLYPTNKNPIQLYNNSSQVINRIDEAYKLAADPKNKNKAAPDLDLVDAYVSIARGGQNITEAQVATLLGGLGVKAKFDVASQKITGTGTLDSGTRKSLYDLSHNIYGGQKTLANEAVGTINKRLSSTGIPDNMLFTDPSEVGDTTSYAGGANINGQQYNVGDSIDIGNGSTGTVNSDGTISAGGHTYDSNGDLIQ